MRIRNSSSSTSIPLAVVAESPSPKISHSSITTASISSSSSSSSSPSTSFSNFPFASPSRCEGLNLLVKAIHHITAGSVVGVPYIQRRVLRRRRRAVRFNNPIIVTSAAAELFSKSVGDGELEAVETKPAVKVQIQREKRVMALPSKYHDSILQPLTNCRRRQRSVKIAGSKLNR